MQHMMLTGQNLSKQFIILFLANMNKQNLFKQKVKTFEFVHNRLYAGLGCRICITPPGETYHLTVTYHLRVTYHLTVSYIILQLQLLQSMLNSAAHVIRGL